LGFLSLAHGHGAQAVIVALAVGAHSIEHRTFFSADGVDTDRDALEHLAASNCVIHDRTG
jgi:imidazolonepropionase-like amidohydrolase